MKLGYDSPLYILPFDHRNAFAESVFNKKAEELTPSEIEVIKDAKYIIFESIEYAIEMGIPKEHAGILVDEEFGDKVLQQARTKGLTTFLTVEKSGQKEFDFQYGDQFKEHIKKYNPTFAKVLIRYNPDDATDSKERQHNNLRVISDFCRSNDIKFLLEALVPATPEQLAKVNNDKTAYDKNLRPGLTVTAIRELQNNLIEPDVWKLEGFYSKEDYQAVVTQTQDNMRERVSVIVLGRNETEENVRTWLIEGAKVSGVTGFAVGRTVFLEPLEKFYKKEIDREQTKKLIAENYYRYFHVFKTQKDLK